jgi:hypothetical protein
VFEHETEDVITFIQITVSSSGDQNTTHLYRLSAVDGLRSIEDPPTSIVTRVKACKAYFDFLLQRNLQGGSQEAAKDAAIMLQVFAGSGLGSETVRATVGGEGMGALQAVGDDLSDVDQVCRDASWFTEAEN